MAKQVYSIQILRAIAAILVVYAHSIDLSEWLHKTSVQGTFKYLQNFGAIGVDIFFAISGFIMVYVTRNMSGYRDAKRFFTKRVIRIYTLYLPLALFFMLYKRPGIYTDIKDITLLPIMDRGKAFLPLTIQVAWTLSFEMLFYLLMTISIRFSKGRHVLVTGVILMVLSLIGMYGRFPEVHLNFLTNPILLEFLFGLVIGWVYVKKIKIAASAILFMIAAAITAFVLLIFNGYGNISEANFTLDGSSSLRRVILWGIPSAMLVSGFVFLERNFVKINTSFKNSILNRLGDASYSIYLTHTILFTAIIATNHFSFSGINGDLLIFVFLVLATGIGYLIYMFMERPLLKRVHQLFRLPA